MAENKKSSIVGKSTCHLLNIKQPERVSKRLKLSFQRTAATISLQKSGREVDASISLIDVSKEGAGFFTHELLVKGSQVEVCIQEPKVLKVRGIVAWSVPVKSGVRNTRFPFRSGIQFVFESDLQKVALTEFIEMVNTDPLEIQRPPAPSEPVSNADAPASGETPAGTEGPAPAGGGEAPVAEAGAAAAPETAAAEGVSAEIPAAETPTDVSAEGQTSTEEKPDGSGQGEPQAA